MRRGFNDSVMKFFALILLVSVMVISRGMAGAEGSKAMISADLVFPLQGKHVHGSSLIELPGGGFLCCWFEGSGERKANDVVIMGSMLNHGAAAWSRPFLMADTPGHPDCNPVMFLDRSNKLHLTWIVVVANKWESSILKTRISSSYELREGPPHWDWQDVILLKPGDEFALAVDSGLGKLENSGAAWASYAPQYDKMICEASKDAAKRETGWMTRIKSLILPEGRILLPLYSDGYNFSLMAISEDGGTTWNPGLPVVERGNVQPALLRKKDGTLVALMRDNGNPPGRIFRSHSSDNGYSWSETRKTGIPNPGSSVDAITLNNGNWLMVCNDLEEGRYRLAVMISDDEGESWRWKRYLENETDPDNRFSYPAVIQSRNGLIHVTYSFHRGEKKSIKHACFQEEWVKEGSSATNAEKLGFPRDRTVLLLHMDDAGMCREANDAAEYYIKNGFLNSAAIIMPCPHAEAFVSFAKKHPEADIGAHLTLTSEWKTYRWGPVSNPSGVPGLIDPEGKLRKDVPEVVQHASPGEVETEIRAQIDRMIELGHPPTHIDAHMGTLYGSPRFLEVFLKTALDYRIPANAIDLSNPEIAENFKKMGYPIDEGVIEQLSRYHLPKLDNFTSVPDGKNYEDKRERFIRQVESLGPGLCEIIFHPSVETDNLKSITNSWQQRVWEAKLFSDPVVIGFFRDKGIILTDWKEIMKRFDGK